MLSPGRVWNLCAVKNVLEVGQTETIPTWLLRALNLKVEPPGLPNQMKVCPTWSIIPLRICGCYKAMYN